MFKFFRSESETKSRKLSPTLYDFSKTIVVVQPNLVIDLQCILCNENVTNDKHFCKFR